MTQRIELLVLIRLEELNSFLLNRTQQIEPFFLNDSKNWILRTLRTELFANVTQKKLNFFFFWSFLEELNPLFLNMTQRFELFSAKKYDSKNWTLGRKKSLKKWNSFSNMTQRKELFFLQFDKEFNFFFFNTTQRIELFFRYYSKNWSFLFSNMIQQIKPWIQIYFGAKELVRTALTCRFAVDCLCAALYALWQSPLLFGWCCLLGLCGEHVLAFSEWRAEGLWGPMNVLASANFDFRASEGVLRGQ